MPSSMREGDWLRLPQPTWKCPRERICAAKTGKHHQGPFAGPSQNVGVLGIAQHLQQQWQDGVSDTASRCRMSSPALAQQPSRRAGTPVLSMAARLQQCSNLPGCPDHKGHNRRAQGTKLHRPGKTPAARAAVGCGQAHVVHAPARRRCCWAGRRPAASCHSAGCTLPAAGCLLGGPCCPAGAAGVGRSASCYTCSMGHGMWGGQA